MVNNNCHVARRGVGVVVDLLAGKGESVKLIHMFLLTGLIAIYVLLFASVPVANSRSQQLPSYKGGTHVR